MVRTVETGNWNASSHEPKLFGSGVSTAMMRDFSEMADVVQTDDNTYQTDVIFTTIRTPENS